ncbi:MAG: hypothetical protein E7159_02885 [Firmicutes bacterium]|nr:hypothetical protein [Bacillota bacterium]
MNKKIIIYIALGIVSLVCILLILFNTILYNYKGKLNSYLNTYYSDTNANLDDVNKVLDKYSKNENKTNNIKKLIEDDVNKRIEVFNKSYDSEEELLNNKDLLVNKVSLILDQIEINKDNYLTIINNLYESKVNYLKGINYFNEGNVSDAYEYLSKVINSDSYYNDSISKIDECFKKEIDDIKNYISSKNISDDLKTEDKLNIYKDILNYVIEKKNTLKLDLTNSKAYNDILNDINKNLTLAYETLAEELKNSNMYDKAVDKLNEGIKLLSEIKANAASLIKKKDDLATMLPVSLTELEGNIEGDSINEELAISDKDNNTYSRVISFYNNSKSSITYNLNKEYKNLKLSVNATGEVNEKNKNYGIIRIYLDNKKVYDSSNLTKSFKKKDLSLDVSNKEVLKIEYSTSSSKNTSKKNIMVGVIGNPTLEKY